MTVDNSAPKIQNIVAAVLVAHGTQAAEYRRGKHANFGFLFGQAMKLTDGKADAQLVNRELQRQLA